MVNIISYLIFQTGCRPDLAAFHNILHTKNKNTNSLNDKYPIPPLDLDSSSDDSEINLNTLSLSSDDDDDDSEKTNVEKLPCEFCEELISIKKLISHQVITTILFHDSILMTCECNHTSALERFIITLLASTHFFLSMWIVIYYKNVLILFRLNVKKYI